jgi:tripartite ATP-independent transporter DctP family solute receptor
VPKQFHNQPERSHQHPFLVDLWDEVRRATSGEVDVSVHALNGGVAGSDPRVLEMLVAGEIEFATMMGPILGRVVPAAEIQGIPFAFRDAAHAHHAMDGALGEHLHDEFLTKGIYLLPGGALDNGMRHICSARKAVHAPGDLIGYRMRVPAGRVFAELFEALGATPVTVNIDGLRAALEAGTVDGHENPLAIVEVNGLRSVSRHIDMTGHAWSGFNLVANLGYWRSLSDHARDAIHRAARTHVARQRRYAAELNSSLEQRLRVHAVDSEAFRARIGAERYARWKERCGTAAWRLLRDAGGRLD